MSSTVSYHANISTTVLLLLYAYLKQGLELGTEIIHNQLLAFAQKILKFSGCKMGDTNDHALIALLYPVATQ